MTCGNCGAALPRGAMFCGSCGRTVGPSVLAPATPRPLGPPAEQVRIPPPPVAPTPPSTGDTPSLVPPPAPPAPSVVSAAPPHPSAPQRQRDLEATPDPVPSPTAPSVRSGSDDDAAAEPRCSECGAPLELGDIFCGDCGAVIRSTTGYGVPNDTAVIDPQLLRDAMARDAPASASASPTPAPPEKVPRAASERVPARDRPSADRPITDALRELRSDAGVADFEATRIVGPRSHGERFVLQFSTGESVTVTGSGLIGRNPVPEPGELVGQLVRVTDPTRSVSKTHLEFGQEAGAFWVRDRYSGNGTILREPDAAPRRCDPGKRYRLIRGSRLDIGEQFLVVS